MKILASIIATAAADYACCPYDDFGVVFDGCTLTEKTPWSVDPGVENNACKAWEANIDATMEGNSDLDNWGGCGFQRHFPWSMLDLSKSDATTLTGNLLARQHCTLGMLSATCYDDTTASTILYKSMTVAPLDGTGSATSYSLVDGTYSDNTANVIFGQVTLGGICKLFIPVSFAHIQSVSIAGVHMRGTNSASVFRGTIVGSNDAVRTGTAYCFTVINVAEYMENTNNIGNGNVAGLNAGTGVSTNDALVLSGDIKSAESARNFGDSLKESTAQSTAKTAEGANFDVVVHFRSDWCIRHWTIVDMQSGKDFGADVKDYALEDDASNKPQHAHTDVADKRFQTGLDGCKNADGDTHDGSAAGILAEGCSAGDSTVRAMNSYVPTGTYQWPNAGAWAAFYSFVTCSDETLMSYGNGQTDATYAEEARMLMISTFYNDVRHESSDGDVIVRGNVRQVGSNIRTCGPGLVKDGDVKRCTWNWNFAGDSEHTLTSPQDWFERTAPDGFNSWNAGVEVDRNIEANAHATNPNAGTTDLQTLVTPFSFTLTFGASDAAGSAVTGAVGTIEFDDTHVATASAANPFTVTVSCTVITDTDSTNDRDLFPDCFMGDEIHFSFTTQTEHVTSWFSSAT